jgi:geranylgeranylglycerol-phosphate geranylgeranyltransferase
MANKWQGYLMMIRPPITMLILVGTLIGGSLDGFQAVNVDLLLAVVIVFLMITGAQVLNDYIDMDVDRIAHPERAIPSGLISPEEHLYITVLAFCGALLISATLNLVIFLVVLVSVVLVILYEKLLKQIALAGNALVAFFGGLAFIFGGAVSGKPYAASLLAVMAFLVMLGREILLDVRDMKGDVLSRATLPMKIGTQKAIYAGCVPVILATLISPLPYLVGIFSWRYLVLMLPADVLFLWAVYLALKNRKKIGIITNMLRTGSAVALGAFIIGLL